MEKKRLIKYVKKYLNDKGYTVNDRVNFGSKCIYERNDLYLVVFMNSSTITKVQYFEFN